MGRSRLLDISQDLVSDSGSVLWSFVNGEQLEFPLTLNFIDNRPLTSGGVQVHPASLYVFESLLIEAANTAGQLSKPTAIATVPAITKLFIRIPTYRGNWEAVQSYNKEDVVYYSNKYYKLLIGAGYISATTPAADPLWEETTLNKVYLQFPKDMVTGRTSPVSGYEWQGTWSAWSLQPTMSTPVYGFYELRVSEPAGDPIFVRTWKPVRGMVEVLFSPTETVEMPQP